MPGQATVLPGDDVLDDVLGSGLRVVFVGMASGRASALRRRHYAGPGNKFWPTLAAVGLTPERLTPDREREILRHGMGLTDVQKHQFGSDVEIEVAPLDLALLREKLARIRPRRIAFNGKRAAGHWLGKPTGALCYGPATDPHGVAEELFILPSTSGAASGFWDVQPWTDLADRVLRDLPSQAAFLSGIS